MAAVAAVAGVDFLDGHGEGIGCMVFRYKATATRQGPPAKTTSLLPNQVKANGARVANSRGRTLDISIMTKTATPSTAIRAFMHV